MIEVQYNPAFERANDVLKGRGGLIAITPPVGETYWLLRVPLSETQAIVAFPKFFTVGIGFQREAEDWNTNLPWKDSAEEIYAHIAKNKGDDAITETACIEAIRAIQEAIKVLLGEDA